MRMTMTSALAALALTLAACGGGSDPDANGDGTISMGEAADQAVSQQGVIRPDPGLYRGTTQLVDLTVSGASQQEVDMIKQFMGSKPRSTEFCLTPEEAEKGFEQMAKEAQESECSFEKFDIQSGKIDAVMNCNSSQRGQARVTLKGTGTRTSSDMTMTMDASAPTGDAMTMTMRTTQERVGDCPA